MPNEWNSSYGGHVLVSLPVLGHEVSDFISKAFAKELDGVIGVFACVWGGG